MALQIFYPNGGTQAVQMYIWNGSAPVLWDGSVTAVVSVGAVDQGNASASQSWLVNLDKVGGASFALGQQLATASLPVVLTAAQLSTLTPPAAITGFATSTLQSNGSQKTQIVDGSGNVIGSTSNALDINIKSGNPTSITADAGTNLNTSLLALEAGGNLAAAAASLSVMDDWDESDRAKVNLIAGQAGIAGGTGIMGATVPRVTLATDDLAALVLGTTGGTKVITDAAGSLQQYLRGLVYLAITTANYPEKAFYGTAQTVINTATDIAAGNFSGAPTTFDNTTDAAVPYARQAVATIQMPDWAAAPAANTTVDLYGILIDTDGSSDDTDAPSGTAVNGARFFGSFPVAPADALQRRTITINLEGVQKVDFYIINRTAQNMNNDAGTNCTLKITPLAYGMVI